MNWKADNTKLIIRPITEEQRESGIIVVYKNEVNKNKTNAHVAEIVSVGSEIKKKYKGVKRVMYPSHQGIHWKAEDGKDYIIIDAIHIIATEK